MSEVNRVPVHYAPSETAQWRWKRVCEPVVGDTAITESGVPYVILLVEERGIFVEIDGMSSGPHDPHDFTFYSLRVTWA